MFDYKYTVKDTKDTTSDWGLFKSRGVAELMQATLALKFKGVRFYVEKIK